MKCVLFCLRDVGVVAFSVAGASVVLFVFCLFFLCLVIRVCAGEVCHCDGV